MITFIRSLPELMIMTKSRDQIIDNLKNRDLVDPSEFKKKKAIESSYEIKKVISLPNLPKIDRQKWQKRKEAVSRFFDELDYNNQIQSSYELTLLESQTNYKQNDAA